MARPRQVSDAEILAAARRVFLRDGPSVAIRAVASEVGISAAAVFHRFGTKRQLLVASLLPTSPAMAPRSVDDRPLVVQMVEIGQELLRYLEELAPSLAVLHAAGIHAHEISEDVEHTPERDPHRHLVDWFQCAQREGRLNAEVDPEIAAMTLAGALQMRALLGLGAAGDGADEVYIRHVAEIICRGVASDEPGTS